MGRIGGLRQVAARELVLALGAGLDARELVRDRVLDGLIVAELEMQERVMLDRAPVAAVERVAADEIDARRRSSARRAWPSPAGCGRALSRRSARRTRASDRAGPICASRSPCRSRRRRPRRSSVRSEPVSHATSMPGSSASLRSRRIVLRLRDDSAAQEIVEGRVAVILPVELLVGALQEAVLAEQAPFGLGQEGDVHRRHLVAGGNLDQRVGERAAHGVRRVGRGGRAGGGRSPA